MPERHHFGAQPADLVLDVNIARLQFQRAAELFQRLGLAARIGQHHGEVIGGNGVGGVGGAAGLQGGDCKVRAAGAAVNQALFMMGHRVIGMGRQQLVPQRQSIIIRAAQADDPGKDRQNFVGAVTLFDNHPVARFGRCQIAGFVQLHRFFQHGAGEDDGVGVGGCVAVGVVWHTGPR